MTPDPQRHAAVALVAQLPVLHIIVVGTPMDPHRQERARRHCLARLFYELERADVTHVWLESRTQTLNARDLQVINVFRIQQSLSDDLRVDHARPLDEPLLWLPDIVAGAAYAALDNDTRYRSPLESLIDLYDVELS